MSTLLEQLTEIRDQHGALNPVLVVDTARDPGHPLHSRFDWDDTVAAHKWRLEQASQLLRAVKMPASPTRPGDLRAFVAVKGAQAHSSDYVPTGEAMEDEFARKLVLRNMEREWRTLKRRWEHMREFADLIARDFPRTGS
jgi:hypothetical protein